jgi:signal peptidase II
MSSTSTLRRDARPLLFVLSALVIVLDRISKLWVVKHIQPGRAIVVIPRVFRITHVLNTGAAFSMFDEAKNPETVRFMLIGFSLVAALVVVGLLWKLGRSINATAIALALILGGAIGNLYDRWKLQHVVDFLEVHIYHYHWPDFNVADSAIVVGACLLLIEMLRPQKN